MPEKSTDLKHFLYNGHLTDEGIAFWVDSLNDSKENDLPDEIREHVDQCLFCKEKIIELYGDLKEIDESGTGPKSKPQISRGFISKRQNARLFFRIAAVILFIISIVAIIYITTENKIDHQQLFAESFQPYPNILTTKGVNKELLITAMYYYDVYKYDSALLFFNQILTDNPQNTEALFYKGNSLLAINKNIEAIDCFQQITSGSESSLLHPAYWYLALAYLKVGNDQKSKEILTSLVEGKNYYSIKAKKLFMQIK